MGAISEDFFRSTNLSIYRALEYETLSQFDYRGRVLDFGGGDKAHYVDMMKSSLDPGTYESVNISTDMVMKRFAPATIKSFTSNLYHCSRLIDHPSRAYGFLRRGHQPEVGSFHLGDLRFRARKGDWVAIREVLINDEYSCVAQILGNKKSPHILDLGANIGSFALRVLRHCPSAQVASVEAANDTFQILKGNRELNPSARWQVFNNGIWGQDGPLRLDRRGSSLSHRVTEGEGDDAIDGIALPTLVAKLGWEAIDLIKMDIEGGELAAVPVAASVLERSRFLIIEIHKDRIDPKPVLDTLRSIYRHCWQIGKRITNKPLYVMTNETVQLSGLNRVELV